MRKPTTPSAIALLLLALVSPAARADFRAPQVPVSGTALATFLASQGQAIDVATDQLDVQALSTSPDVGFEVHLFGSEAQDQFGGYNAALAVPPLYLLAPGAAAPGWFAMASFKTAPARLIVNLFDGNGSFVATTTYLGADRNNFAFYCSSPGGMSYTQDARNAGGAARILAYAGTGSRAGWTWFACETGPGPGGDFADSIALVHVVAAPVPVLRTNWGALKQHFR